MHALSALYSESFQKKKIAMGKLFHEKPLQVSDKLLQLYSFSSSIILTENKGRSFNKHVIQLVSIFHCPPDFDYILVTFDFPCFLSLSHHINQFLLYVAHCYISLVLFCRYLNMLL